MNANQKATQRRTLAQARRAPQWQRLIDSIHKAQEAAGYAGRQFGEAEMQHFSAELVGMPQEVGAYRGQFAAYWVERTVFEHSDGTESITYALKCVYGDNLASVERIADATAHTTGYDGAEPAATPEWEAATALDFINRAKFQTGAKP